MAQERNALGKVDKIRADNAARAQALEREAADAEQKVCQRIEDYGPLSYTSICYFQSSNANDANALTNMGAGDAKAELKQAS